MHVETSAQNRAVTDMHLVDTLKRMVETDTRRRSTAQTQCSDVRWTLGVRLYRCIAQHNHIGA